LSPDNSFSFCFSFCFSLAIGYWLFGIDLV
jgi:hypothetical protein